MLKQGVKAWNEWRKENTDIIPDLSLAYLSDDDLSGADLIGVDLSGADLSGADLSYANLSGAILIRADLILADLIGVDLSGADLSGADLSRADLAGANLSYANLTYATFSRAYLRAGDLRGADLAEARLGYTTLADVDLSEVKGLETVQHAGPSSIDIDTFYASKGNIPHKFLLNAGVPKETIDYLLPLAGKAIDFYTCFISYSTKDQEFAQRLHADLQAKGVRCWFAPEDIAGGKKIHEQIDQAIRLYDKLLVVLSENSMASEWVKTEIYHARQQEVDENRRKLFPISLVGFDTIRQWRAFDADIGKDMAREVREYFIPDFSQWKDHDTYQKAFHRLLRALRAEAS